MCWLILTCTGSIPKYRQIFENFFNTMGTQTESFISALLAMIALSVVQSSAQTFIYNAILFIDTSDNAWYNKLIG